MKNEQYWLITYIKQGERITDNEYPYCERGRLPDETVSQTIDEPWEKFVSRNGIKAVVFLKEITKDEWGFAPF